MTNIEVQYFGLSFIDSCKTTKFILRTETFVNGENGNRTA